MAVNWVTPEWLESRLQDDRVLIFDLSWYQANEHRDAAGEYERSHLPGAKYLPLEALGVQAPLPHTLPPCNALARVLQNFGVTTAHHVVAYDASGFRTAARLWWLLRWAGHGRVSVLEGGVPLWRSLGLAMESGNSQSVPAPRRYPARCGRLPVVTREMIVDGLNAAEQQIIDARPRERFRGERPEPREGLRAGHIPGSVCLPLSEFVDSESGRFTSRVHWRERLGQAGIDLAKPVIATCGSGIAASAIVMIVNELGGEGLLYDGSWCDWGSQAALPIATI